MTILGLLSAPTIITLLALVVVMMERKMIFTTTPRPRLVALFLLAVLLLMWALAGEGRAECDEPGFTSCTGMMVIVCPDNAGGKCTTVPVECIEAWGREIQKMEGK